MIQRLHGLIPCGPRPQPKNWNRGFRRLHRLKIITNILAYLQCYLKEVYRKKLKDCVLQVTQNSFYFFSVISVISVAKKGEEK